MINLHRETGHLLHAFTAIIKSLIRLIAQIHQISLDQNITFIIQIKDQRAVPGHLFHLVQIPYPTRSQDNAGYLLHLQEGQDLPFRLIADLSIAQCLLIAVKETLPPPFWYHVALSHKPQVGKIRYLMIICCAVHPFPVNGSMDRTDRILTDN